MQYQHKWGSTTSDRRLVEVNGRDCEVYTWLEGLLVQLRHEEAISTLWIDNLCIHQSNTLEKNRQVALMGKIYGQAERVLVSLGEHDESSKYAFEEMISVEEQHYKFMQEGSVRDIPFRISRTFKEIGDAMFQLCNRDYWQRAWVRQEIILARRIQLHCGFSIVSWEVFKIFLAAFLGRNLPSGSSIPELIVQQAIPYEQKLDTLERLVVRYSYAKCTDVRDRVYSLLSLAHPSLTGGTLEVDYSISPDELVQKVVSYCEPHKTENFDVLVTNAMKETHHGIHAWVLLPCSLFNFLKRIYCQGSEEKRIATRSPKGRRESRKKVLAVLWRLRLASLRELEGSLSQDRRNIVEGQMVNSRK